MRQAKALLVSLLSVSAVQAQEPLSAIDWLNEPVSVSLAAPRIVPPNEPPVADGVATPSVVVMPLDAQQSDSVGLLPGSTTGLPQTLWQASTTSRLNAQLASLPVTPLPATQALYYTLLLASEAGMTIDVAENEENIVITAA